jgi:hypothetical protein
LPDLPIRSGGISGVAKETERAALGAVSVHTAVLGGCESLARNDLEAMGRAGSATSFQRTV